MSSAAADVVPSSPSRLAWLDVLRGLAVLGVVLGHSVYLLSWHDVSASGLAPPLRLAQHVRLPLLFLVSGVLFAAYSARPWRLVVRNRLIPLLWTLLVWLVVERVVRSVVGVLPVPTPLDVVRYVAAGLREPPVDYLWFVWALLVASLVARFLHRWRWLLVLGFLAGASGAVARVLPPEVLGRQTEAVLTQTPYFFAGFVVSPLLLRWGRRLDWRSGAVWVPVAVVWAVGVLVLLPRVVELPGALTSLLLVVPTLPAAAALSGGLANLPGGGVLVGLGRRTLPVYVVHMPVVIVLVYVVPATLPGLGERFPELVALGVAAVAVGTGLALKWLTAALGVRGLFEVPRFVHRGFDAAVERAGALRQGRRQHDDAFAEQVVHRRVADDRSA